MENPARYSGDTYRTTPTASSVTSDISRNFAVCTREWRPYPMAPRRTVAPARCASRARHDRFQHGRALEAHPPRLVDDPLVQRPHAVTGEVRQLEATEHLFGFDPHHRNLTTTRRAPHSTRRLEAYRARPSLDSAARWWADRRYPSGVAGRRPQAFTGSGCSGPTRHRASRPPPRRRTADPHRRPAARPPTAS